MNDQENAWPARDVLIKLVEAADLLLDHCNYDGDGHEEIGAARAAAREHLVKDGPYVGQVIDVPHGPHTYKFRVADVVDGRIEVLHLYQSKSMKPRWSIKDDRLCLDGSLFGYIRFIVPGPVDELVAATTKLLNLGVHRKAGVTPSTLWRYEWEKQCLWHGEMKWAEIRDRSGYPLKKGHAENIVRCMNYGQAIV